MMEPLTEEAKPLSEDALEQLGITSYNSPFFPRTPEDGDLHRRLLATIDALRKERDAFKDQCRAAGDMLRGKNARITALESVVEAAQTGLHSGAILWQHVATRLRDDAGHYIPDDQLPGWLKDCGKFIRAARDALARLPTPSVPDSAGQEVTDA